jgi:ELWxxDGT repeat protein
VFAAIPLPPENVTIPTLHAFPLAVVALLAAPIASQQPQLIADLNPAPLTQPFDSNPRPLARLGGEVLLAAQTPFTGTELYAMDLATRNVRLVADIYPGTRSSGPVGSAVFGGSLWFAATDASGQQELWRSDGTQAGTSRVLDIGGSTSSSPREIRVVNGRLVFVANGGSAVGTELFVSDGTAAGTQVVDIHPGAASSYPEGLFVVGGHVYCAATRPGEGSALWRSDGTVAGTQLVMDPAPGSAFDGPVSITSFQNQVLFGGGGQLWLSNGTAAGSVAIQTASVGTVAATATTICYVAGQGLFATNGAPGTAQQIAALPGASWPPAPIQAFGQRFLLPFFSTFGSARTYLTDGTAAGTATVAVSAELEFAVLGNRIYFGGNDYSGGGPVLWSSDGTPAGTAPVGGGFDPEALFAVPGTGQLLFSAWSVQVGRELWGSDGTAAGTALIANLADESLWSQGSDPDGFVDAAGTLFFVAKMGTASSLWRSDGTAAGTIALGAAIAGNSGRLTAVGTRVFYTGYDAMHGAELWVSDGTPAGTRLVHDAFPGPGNGGASYPIAADDWLYYQTYNGSWPGLWRTDGTAAGTVPIVGWGTIAQAEPLGRGLVFTLWQFSGPKGLYYTDGTQAGTVRLADLSTSVTGAEFDLLERVGDRVFATGFLRDRLFVTDGTVAGTVELTAAMTAPPQSIDKLIAFRGQLVFQAWRPGRGVRFWISDGSPFGTREWFVPTGGGSLSGHSHKVMGDLILWNGSDGIQAPRLWRTDGTAAGTFPLRNQEPHYIETTGDRAAWFGSNGPAGAELWRTDGTVAGTVQVADLVPGATGSFPAWQTLSSGKLFFRAAHPQFGNEPWVIDVGTNHQQVGYSCSARGTAGPELSGSDPVLGTTMTLTVRGGPDPGLSLALIDNHTTGTSRIGVGYCARFLDPGSLGWSLQIFQNGLVQHLLPIPNNPALVGLLFRNQALVLGAGGIPELEMSNGVAAEIGN